MELAYASVDLYLPRRAHDVAELLVGRGHRDTKPFERQVDFWWAGLCVGIALDLQVATGRDAVKFNQGSILQSDATRIIQLELLALAKCGPGALDSPREVLEFASRYANGGCLWLVDKLNSSTEPIVGLFNELTACGMLEGAGD
jgi:hypothetical protein